MAGLDGSSDFKHPDNLHTTASEKDLQLIFSKTKAKQGEKSNASADDSMFVPTSHRYTGPQHYGAASAVLLQVEFWPMPGFPDTNWPRGG